MKRNVSFDRTRSNKTNLTEVLWFNLCLPTVTNIAVGTCVVTVYQVEIYDYVTLKDV